jgi:DNA-binding MarR family transcriptional regulator
MEKINFRHISKFETPDKSPGYLLWQVSTRWRIAIEAVLKPLNLTHPQFVLLATIAWLIKDGKSVSQADIGRMASLDPNTTSQIIRGLEAKQFIKRTQSVDERSKNPTVTTLGAEQLSKALPAVEKADSDFFAKLETTEASDVVKLFQKLMR